MPWMEYQGRANWVVLVGTFLAIAIWESLLPYTALRWPTERRWGRHAALFSISILAKAALLPLSTVFVATAVSGSRFGVLNSSEIPFAIRFVLTILLLDLARYGIHWAFHSIRPLWRIHEIHHCDPDYDVSTAARFHPAEALLQQACQLGWVALLAPPPVAVFASELISSGVNLFVHANACLPTRVESIVRLVIITPDLHRIHHSEELLEQSTNFGQTFSFWDRCFGTLLNSAGAGQNGLITGIRELRNDSSLRLRFMLSQPFGRRKE